MVMSRNQNAGQNHNIKIDRKSFERVEEFKYLVTIILIFNEINIVWLSDCVYLYICFVTTLTNRNSIHEEIKSRLKSGNACYHSVLFQVAIQKHKD
jgi:hypothetical protein